MSRSAYFVTGTDTGVGKTTVSRALLAAATARGWRTRCFKPAESGCERGADGTLMPRDAESLWEATDRGQPKESACLYRFEEPVAPGVAASRLGMSIDLGAIARALAGIQADAPDFLLVEGAGGLLVPLSGGKSIADLAVLLGLPLLIVARPTLGTINHTLLTIEAARHRGLSVEGVIFSCGGAEVNPSAAASNAAEIREGSGVPVLGMLPNQQDLSLASLASAIEAIPGLMGLLPRRAGLG
jgi:dethiobiotin synthetase